MERDKLKPCAYSVANVFSKFSMSWIYPVLKVGHKRKLKITDLYKVADEHQSAHLCEKLEKNWKEEVRQAEVAHRQPSLFRTTLKTYFPNIVLLSTILVIAEVLKGCGPILIGELTRYFNNYKNLPLWQGYTYATGIAATALLAPYCYQCFFILIPIIGWNMRTAMVALMYKKTLKLSQEALLKTTSGNIINLSSTDVIRFDLMFHYAPFIWIAPIEAAVVIYILWRRLGPSPLVGMGVLLFIMILQSYNGKLFGKLRLKIAKLTDSRVALMNEIISGMRIIKMYSWENAFRDMALSLRKKEIRKIMLASLLRSFNLSMSYSASQILTYTTFMVYVGLNGSLTTEAVFVAIGLFTVIRLAVGVFFPVAIEKFAEGTAAIRRIEAFLLLPEKETITGNIDSGEPLVSFENYTGSWIKDKPPALSDVSLKLNERRLLTVVGAVGSGKTSLLSAVLGELSAVAGEVKVVGKVGYCSQVAWLFADTIRENILFGETFNPDRYSAVVEACSLQKDFDILPSGDQTLIGERGVTLSGGQKARISLARIAYRSDLDIILLDDPLSAVDPLVAEHLFTKCICGFMKDKIRILVTHQLQFLSRAEQILSLKKGKVADMGLFEELQKREMDFASLAKPKVEKGIKQSVRKKILKRSISRMSSIDLGEFTTCYPSSFDFEIPFVTTEEDEMFFEESIDQSGQSFGSSTYPADVSDDLQQPSKNMNNHNNKKVVEEEDEIKGIGIKVYYQYIVLGINLVYTLCYLFVTIGTHVILILSDWWIATWAFLEEQQSNALVGDIALMNITNQMMRNLTSAVNFTTGEPLANATSSQPLFNRQYYWIIYSFLTPCFVVAMFIRCVMHFYLCLSSNVKLHSGMLSAVFKAKIRFFDTHSVGSVLNRFSKDLGQIDELLPAAFIDFIFFSMTTLGIICYVISVNYFVPIVVIPLLIYFVKVRQFFVKSFREIKRIEGTNRSPVFSHLSNTLQGLFTIRTLGMQKKFIDKYDKLQDLHGASWFAFLSASRWLSFRLDTLTGIFVSFVAYFSVIIVLYLPNTPVNASTIGLTLTYCINMLSTIQWMVRQSAEVESAMTSVERIREYHNIPAESGDKNEKKDIPSGWPEKGIVSFENVSYAHFKDGPLVLKNLNLKFKAKEKVGIVGRTGAGKSSFISTLFRLSDQISGEITIDGIDTSQINLNELRGSLAIIPQDPMLFSGTIRTNLDMFSSYTDQQLWDTLEQVQLKSVVEAFPMKMETELAESGSNFSVGQRQLVCLARAILRKNRILIIDEATANVDINTDRLIQETIRKEFAHCTVFTIAHRLNTIIDSDRILVLDAGCVVEFGEPHVLLQKKGGSFDEMIRNTGDEEVKLRNMAKKTYLEKNAIQEKAET